MQIFKKQEIPYEYAIEEFQAYYNPIKVTLVSPLGGMANCDYNQKKKKDNYNQFYHVLKEGGKKCIREVW